MKTIRIVLDNGDMFTTRINATWEEITEKYCIGKEINTGKVYDDFHKIVSVSLLKGERR